jgi:hypothetical protein
MQAIAARPARRVLLCSLMLACLVASADSQPAYLDDAGLRTALQEHTLIGNDWAEFYAADGAIKGKGRQFGMVRTYSARWRISEGKVFYDYQGTAYDTWSRLARDGETIRHYTVDGEPKRDGVARRVKGDQIASALD